MSRRCAIYTRYSSDMQREASIEDQERRCREYAQQQAWSVVEEHVVADRAISGASVAGRSTFLRLMEAAVSRGTCPISYGTSTFSSTMASTSSQWRKASTRRSQPDGRCSRFKECTRNSSSIRSATRSTEDRKAGC